MSTYEKIWNLICDRPMSRSEIARKVGRSEKTVSNLLSLIHNEIYGRTTRRSRGARYVVAQDGSRRLFGVFDHNDLSDSNRWRGKNFKRQTKNRISSYDGLPLVFYKR